MSYQFHRAMFKAFSIALALFSGVLSDAAEVPAERLPPKEIGSRTVILSFTVDENAKPLAVAVVSSEAAGLNPWATAMIKAGQVKTTSPGVVKVAERKYRANISFALEGDGAALPSNITLPKAQFQPAPRYPFELARADTSGGVLLRLTIGEKANIEKVEVVRASHREFSDAVLTAVKKWRFAEPARKAGMPIAVTLYQLITFEIAGKTPALWEWQMCPEPAFPEYTVSGSYVPTR